MMTTRACAALALLLTAACRAPADDAASARAPQTDTPAAVEPAPSVLAPNVFDPGRAQVGDTVAGMRITRMSVDTAYDGHPVGSVWFAGEARVSGRYQPHPDDAVQALCFFADSASAARLPRFPRDERRAWFCFADQDRARRLLRAPPDTGHAAIVIDGFAYHFSYSDAFNEARLVSSGRPGTPSGQR